MGGGGEAGALYTRRIALHEEWAGEEGGNELRGPGRVGRQSGVGELLPVVVLVVGQLQVCGQAGQEACQPAELVGLAEVQLELLVEQVERPEEGGDEGEEGGCAGDLAPRSRLTLVAGAVLKGVGQGYQCYL